MKSFLLKDKRPLTKWGLIPDGYFFEGKVPEGYALAVCPGKDYIVLDVDSKDAVNGWDNIPTHILLKLKQTYNYPSKSGRHFWLKYTGDVKLLNRTTEYGLDLRTENGYVRWYPQEDVRHILHKIQPTDDELNSWLSSLFGPLKLRKK